MTFVPDIGLGTCISMGVTVAGIIGVWFTTKEQVRRLLKQADVQETQHAENQKRMAALEIQIARECVRVDDFRRLEERMDIRFEKMQDAIANGAQRTVQHVKDAIRDLVTSRGRE